MNKLETRKATYKGTLKDGTIFENYLFANGQIIYISDMFVNATNPRSAYNKIAKKLGLYQYNKEHEEEFEYEVKDGYINVEEVNYYDIDDNETYRYYVSIIWSE